MNLSNEFLEGYFTYWIDENSHINQFLPYELEKARGYLVAVNEVMTGKYELYSEM